MASRRILICCAFVLLSVLSFHFFATAVSLQPTNPLKDRLSPLVSAYIQPYFIQNWRLFAPDPLEPTKRLWVSCRVMAGDGSSIDTDFADITAPHYEALHTFRLSPSQRLLRGQLYGLTLIRPPQDKWVETLEDLKNDSDENLRRIGREISEARERVKREGIETLARVASAECARRYPENRIHDVRVVYTHETAPAFSKRNQPDATGETVEVDYGRHPYRQVAIY